MCGIVGYVGADQAQPVLLQGLEKLEYRGYDSAGIAVYDGTSIRVVKTKGRLKALEKIVQDSGSLSGCVGIGHTRWATHGKPSDENAHPHVSGSGKFAVVHNGIIENYLSLKTFLTEKGCRFLSETDTEVVAQLLDYHYSGDLLEAVAETLKQLRGSYALGILCSDYPDRIIAVRKDSPLIVGLGSGENYIAFDVPAILGRTRDILRLDENEIAVITAGAVKVARPDGTAVEKTPEHITWDISAAEKGGYDCFMEKEIMEQPKAVRDTILPRIRDGRVVLDEISLSAEQIRDFRKIFIVACGSAYHVGVVAKYIFEQYVHIPVEVDVASEFRYRGPILDAQTLVLVISQSGETADTLAALREAKSLGSRTLAIVNVVGSSIANEADDVLYTRAGPEIAVATTKAYSAQLSVIYLLAVFFADLRGSMTADDYKMYIAQLLGLPDQIEKALAAKDRVRWFAEKVYRTDNIFFIGRNIDYAMSLEGSLKLKEISYIHSEAYAAGEMKHGTISLIEDKSLVVALATERRLYEKMMGNVREVKARGAVVLGVTTEDNRNIEKETDYAFYVPKVCDMMLPSLAVIPLQIFAYDVAYLKGCDIDKPRNLAKSVTVE